MEKLLKLGLNLYIYSSIHIAICVSAMILEMYYILGLPVEIDSYIKFCFLSTILIYTLHKIVGAYKSKTPSIGIRIKLFKDYHRIFQLYAILIIPILSYFLFQLSLDQIKLLILPGLISLFYVFPFDHRGNRLRDYAYVKIFLIALVWMVITVIIPMNINNSGATFTWLLSMEKLLFIIALTLPFDIRDIKIDKVSGVKTLASRLGLNGTLAMSTLLIFLAILCVSIAYMMNFVSITYLIIIVISYGISLAAIFIIINKSHDYYFAGILDAMMLVPFLFILLTRIIG